MKWLQIVRTEESYVYVKTDRGIEAAKKQNNFCNYAVNGDFALCKSVQGQLVMMDYSKEGGVA